MPSVYSMGVIDTSSTYRYLAFFASTLACCSASNRLKVSGFMGQQRGFAFNLRQLTLL
jgi:hypothetical protein